MSPAVGSLPAVDSHQRGDIAVHLFVRGVNTKARTKCGDSIGGAMNQEKIPNQSELIPTPIWGALVRALRG
jgi:hypothetical protein